jgi:transcriptional regulator with XRE-family HTH domain
MDISPDRPSSGRARDEAFGARVKRLRHRANLTLQQLSSRSGLASSTISKVENSQISLTYENILRLAAGLEIDVAALFAPEPDVMAAGRRSVTRAGEGSRLASPPYDYEIVCADLSHKKFFPLVATVRARGIGDFPQLVRHSGEEYIYVLSGEVEMHTDLYEPLRLRPGDSCYLDSNMGHALISVSEKDAVVVWVCTTPGPAGPAAASPVAARPARAKRQPTPRGKPRRPATPRSR